MKKIMLTLFLAAAAAQPASSSTMGGKGKTCPVCLSDFFYRVQMSATVFDTGLDFRPVGMIMSPPPLPVCGECGFIAYASTASARDLASWRAAADSEEYRALSGRSSYYRLAFLAGRLGGEQPFNIANIYLKASWEEEDEPEKMLEDLRLALARTEAGIAGVSESSYGWAMAQYMRAELLRRLSAFREAKRALALLRGNKFAKDRDLARMIKYQRLLCSRKDPAPRAVNEMKGEGVLTRVRDYFRWLF